METTQVMMMPMASATPAPAASSAVAMAGSDCACAGGQAGFGSLLGQTLGQLFQGEIPLVKASADSVAAEVMPMPSLTQDLPELTTLLSGLVEGSTDAADADQQQAVQEQDQQALTQQLAGYFQAAMMVPAAPVAAPAATAAVPEVTLLVDVAAVQTVATVTPVMPELVEASQVDEGQMLELPQQKVTAHPQQPAAMPELKVGENRMQQLASAGKTAVNSQQTALPAQQPESSEQQEVAAFRAVETARQTDVVKAVQAGAVPLAEMARSMAVEAPAAPKAAVSSVAPFRFAQPSDVVAATAQPCQQQQQNFSQFGQAKGGELPMQTAAAVTIDPSGEAALFELNQNPAAQLEPAGLGQTQRQNVQVVQPAVVEAGRMAPEQQAMKQVTDRLDAHQIKQGADQITLKLSPEHLGNLQLNIRMDDQQVRVEIVAEHRAVRDALLQQVEQLKESLSRQNIKMESFDVTTANNGGLNQQQGGDWRQTASERRPILAQQYGAPRAASGSNGEMDGTMQYFGPQYHATLDVRF